MTAATEKAWDDAATKAAVAQLDSIRSTAEKWAGTVTALLGVFSAVALVTGTTQSKDISNDVVKWVLVAVVAFAGAAAISSIVAASRAAQGTTPVLSSTDGDQYRTYIIANTQQARPFLKFSRYAGLTAAALVFAIGITTLILAAIPAGDPTGSSVTVLDRNGGVSCGKLDVGPDGVTTVGGKPVPPASQIVPVTSC